MPGTEVSSGDENIAGSVSISSGTVNVGNFPATQPVSAVALPLPAGAATQATLASIDAGIPVALGTAVMAGSMPVTIASDQPAIPISGTVTVAPAAANNVKPYRNNVVGVGTWSIAASTHGGKVKSVTFRRRAGGGAGTVTITDNFGTVTTILAGEVETWGVGPLDDELIGPLSVTTTAAANDVIIDWTEV